MAEITRLVGKYSIGILIIAFAHSTFGQRQLSISPGIGMNFGFSYTIDDSKADLGFRPNTFTFGAVFSAKIYYRANQRHNYFIGIENTRISNSLLYGTVQKDLYEGRLTASSGIIRVPLGVEHYISNIAKLPVFSSKKKAIKYLLQFRLYALYGLSLNHIVQQNYSKSFSRGEYVVTAIKPYYVNPFIGIKLRFFSKKRDLFQLELVYHQGLYPVSKMNVNYYLKSGNYSAVIGSRGSALSIKLSYPIVLWREK